MNKLLTSILGLCATLFLLFVRMPAPVFSLVASMLAAMILLMVFRARKIRLASFVRMILARPNKVEFANIGEGTFGDGKKSYIPDAATTSRYLLYKTGSDADHCVICGAGDDPLGPSDDQADANRLDVPIAINILGATKGTVRVVTDGTVANGNYVKAGANGQVTVAVTTNLSFGRAVITTDATSAAGDVITIIPMVPAKYAF